MYIKPVKLRYIIGIILLSMAPFSTCFSQSRVIRFFCSEDTSDSIPCKITITDKAGNKEIFDEYKYSCLIDIRECKQIDCVPSESSVFYVMQSHCSQLENVILIKIKSKEDYLNYRKAIEKIRMAQVKASETSSGQNNKINVKALSF